MTFSKRAKGELGKASEDAISNTLKTWDSRQAVAWHRIPDARAGSAKAALADFYILYNGQSVLVEVKEVDHTHRLPHQNFTVDQVARMRRFNMAGAMSLVLVHFTKTDSWRAARPEWFIRREGGSWGMSQLPARTLHGWLQPYAEGRSLFSVEAHLAMKDETCSQS